MNAAAVRIVLRDRPGADAVPEPRRAEMLRTLLDKGYSVACTRSGEEARPASGDALLVVLGRFDGGTPAADGPLRFQDIDGLEPAAVLERVEALRDEAQAPRPGGWKPWFPVIDYSRCTNCMQCLSFCLFDVYGATREGKIQVRNQDNCKTDCPACSRVCPEVAILFPKYRQGPINGDEVNADDLRREAMKVDISALLGGDVYALLRDRSAKAKSRFSKERDEERALKERQNCLVKLRDQMGLDIPPEVLASLPSPDEIRAKAETAQARAREALEAAARTAPVETERGADRATAVPSPSVGRDRVGGR